MPVFILQVKVPSAPKRSTEIMIKGDTIEDALKGAEVRIYDMKRTVETKPYTYVGHTPGSMFTQIYYKRMLRRMVNLEVQ